jgi:hypothetical protein
VATLAGDEPTILTFDLRQREAFIEIRATSSHEGVTVIEFVSPSNKYASGQGKVEYRKKQDQVTAGSANLVEVDLLRRGQPVVMAPVGQLLALPSFDYVACVNRASQPGQAEIYPFTLRERMPRVKIPLRVEDADVVLDLPSVFTRGYDSGAFGLRVDYRLPPPGPLRADDGPWLDGLLRDAGARGA